MVICRNLLVLAILVFVRPFWISFAVRFCTLGLLAVNIGKFNFPITSMRTDSHRLRIVMVRSSAGTRKTILVRRIVTLLQPLLPRIVILVAGVMMLWRRLRSRRLFTVDLSNSMLNSMFDE